MLPFYHVTLQDVHSNFETFSLQLSDCYIRVLKLPDCCIRAKNYSSEQALLLHDKYYLQGEGSCFMKDPMISVYLRFEFM